MSGGRRAVTFAGGLLTVAFLACLQPIYPVDDDDTDGSIPQEDAGDDAGSVADGGRDASDAGPGQPDGGELPDSGTLLDAGVPVGFVWTPTAGLGETSSTAHGLHGTSASNVYLVGRGGGNTPRIWRYSGTTWAPVLLPALAPAVELFDVFVFPTGDVYAAGEASLVSCDSSCDTGGSVVTPTYVFDSRPDSLRAVCGDALSGTVYAFGFDPTNNQEPGVLYRHTASWGARQPLSGIQNILDCHLRSSGELFLAGRSRVGRFDGNAVTALDPILPPGVDLQEEQFHSVWGTGLPDGGYQLFAGATGGRIYETNGIDRPTLAFQGPGTSPIQAIAGVSIGEVYALPRSASENALRYSDGGWEVVTGHPAFEVDSLWAADRDTYFAAGEVAGTAAAARSARP